MQLGLAEQTELAAALLGWNGPWNGPRRHWRSDRQRWIAAVMAEAERLCDADSRSELPFFRALVDEAFNGHVFGRGFGQGALYLEYLTGHLIVIPQDRQILRDVRLEGTVDFTLIACRGMMSALHVLGARYDDPGDRILAIEIDGFSYHGGADAGNPGRSRLRSRDQFRRDREQDIRIANAGMFPRRIADQALLGEAQRRREARRVIDLALGAWFEPPVLVPSWPPPVAIWPGVQ